MMGDEAKVAEPDPAERTAARAVLVNHPTGPALRLRQGRHVLRRAVRHPQWIAETVRGAMLRRRERRRSFSLSDYRDLFVREPDVVMALYGCAEHTYQEACAELGALALGDALRPVFGARAELVRIVSAVVRLSQPAVVVETGVAQGVTTTAILSAMARNGQGHLYSIDLPVLFADERDFVGRLVPQPLWDRWTLELGPSRSLLAPLLQRVGPLDVFLHDADHSYLSQLEEYRTVWPRLRSGGVLLSDDVANPAFLEFAAEVGTRPWLVGDPALDSAVGILRKFV